MYPEPNAGISTLVELAKANDLKVSKIKLKDIPKEIQSGLNIWMTEQSQFKGRLTLNDIREDVLCAKYDRELNSYYVFTVAYVETNGREVVDYFGEVIVSSEYGADGEATLTTAVDHGQKHSDVC